MPGRARHRKQAANMLQARGPAPFDPYRILQLHPCAPRGLVVEVYWMLVERARRRPRSIAAGDSDALRLAFEMLTAANRHAPPLVARDDDYYAILRIDPDADADVIDLAHGVLSRTAASRGQREVLDIAHQTLSNSYRRASYDATRRSRDGVTPLTDLLRSKAGSADVATIPRPFESRLQAATEAPLTLDDAGEAPPSLGRDAPAAVPETEAFAVEPDAEAIAPRAQDDARTALAHEEPAAAEEPAGVAWVDATGRADLEFVAGPRAGQRVAIVRDTLTLGRGGEADIVLVGAGVPIAPKHARVWRVRDRYVLRRLDGEDLLLNGAPMTLPAVPLEDGDEFAIGAHTVRFTRGSA